MKPIDIILLEPLYLQPNLVNISLLVFVYKTNILIIYKIINTNYNKNDFCANDYLPC